MKGQFGGPIGTDRVAEEIRARTQQALEAKGGDAAVTEAPLVMRVRYAYCPNLTLWDTPGLILKAKEGDAGSTPDEIGSMVRNLLAPPHRLIVFLQQSNVEWSSSLWLPIIQEADPLMLRSIVVVSKFDNRVKEFEERWEVDQFLSASGYLPDHATPFFVALPKDRAFHDNAAFRGRIVEVDEALQSHLRNEIQGGFDPKYAAQVGFPALKKHLEGELQRRYATAVPQVLSLLSQRGIELRAEAEQIETQLKSCSDVRHVRTHGMKRMHRIVAKVLKLLQGASRLRMIPNLVPTAHSQPRPVASLQGASTRIRPHGATPAMRSGLPSIPTAKNAGPGSAWSPSTPLTPT